ncbi:MAG: dihydroorotase [Salinisphaeraceae bacterium]|nr:dihydroorotase [Salinisphaeraceae bacterium]
MNSTLISNARVVNEGRIFDADVLVKDGRIDKIDSSISAPEGARVIDARGRHLLPGMIDDQVHFREPGLTHKAEIATESAACVAGGITSFMEMPNVKPPTLDQAAVEDKRERASRKSLANFAFYLGAANDNIDAIRSIDPTIACGLKVFMGASTGNMLVDDDNTLRRIFDESPLPIITHCEDTPLITANEQAAREKYGEDVPPEEHPYIRSEEACWLSSAKAVALAKEYDSRLHVIHVTTARELQHFTPGPVAGKRITAEACVHHLWFDESDYAEKRHLIKCNPAIKRAEDREALLKAVAEDRIDVIATDHAPHLAEEKAQPYFGAPSGLPLVQEALLTVLEHVRRGVFSLEHAVKKTSHSVAECYQVAERGFIREGYWADLTLVDLETPTDVDAQPVFSKCGWTPFAGTRFSSSIAATMVSGQLAWYEGKIDRDCRGRALLFDRS